MNPARKPKVKPQRKRFSHRRDPAYCSQVRETQPCVLTGKLRIDYNSHAVPHECMGPLELMHVKSRGSGGSDCGNVVMGCKLAHAQEHLWGIKTFQKTWSVDLGGEAARIERELS